MTVPQNLATERDRARLAAADVEGWLSEDQGRALFEAAARATGRGRIVEIGSWKGRSTVWLAHGARLAGQQVYAIDPHTGSHEDPSARTFEAFTANVREAGVEGAVVPMVMSSADAAARLEGGVEVLFIDGDHSDAGAAADVSIWIPRLIDGGVVLMHDVVTIAYTGPLRVFRQRLCWGGGFGRIRRVGSMGIATRMQQRGPLTVAWAWMAGILLYAVDIKRWIWRMRHR